MIAKVAGFCLVEESSSWHAVPGLPPYKGYERDPWGHQWENGWYMEDFRTSGPPVEYREQNRDLTGIALVSDLEWALGLLADGQEVLALTSPRLCGVKGAVPIDNVLLDWLGYEPFAEWSLISNGIYSCPALFADTWGERLNCHGLLEDVSLGRELLDDYVSLMPDGDDELTNQDDRPEPMYNLELDVVRIARVTHRFD